MKKGRILVIVMSLALLPVLAVAKTPENAKDEMGLTRMMIVYPERDETIDSLRPMIAVDLTALETPVDVSTVMVTLDGIDVTDSAEITNSYIVYRPPKDLFGGKHEVGVTAKDINKKRIESLTWVFHIKGYIPGYVTPDNTDGQLVVSTDYSQVDYTRSELYDVTDILREKEGMKLNVDLDVSNITDGRTIIGTYHRETQMYTDVEIDKVRMSYFDSHFEASLGHFWVELSDFTIAGTEMGGLKIDKKEGPWELSFFTGRTQDPSTSGTFKQITTGTRNSFNWGNRNKTSLTFLYAEEKNDAFFSQVATPAKDQITSFLHEYKHNESIAASLEIAGNNRTVRGNTSDHDEAYKLSVSAKYRAVSGEIEVYNIGENFLPIAGGNARFLQSNRDGYRGKVKAKPAKWVTTGAEYEQYDSEESATLSVERTKRGNAFVALSSGRTVNVTYRKNKLTTTRGVISESDLVTATFFMPKAHNVRRTRLSTSWQDIDYSDSNMFVNTRVLMCSLNTSYKDVLGLSFSYIKSEIDAIIINAFTTNRKYMFGLDWKIVPRRLTWSGKYEIMDSSGTSVDNKETRLKTMMRYISGEVYAYTLGCDLISYDNVINPNYNYDQKILRSGVEWNF